MWQPEIQEQYLQGMAQQQAIYRMRQMQQNYHQQQQHHLHHHQQICGDNRMQFPQQPQQQQQQHPIVPPLQVQQPPQQQQQCTRMNSVGMMDVTAHSSNPRASRNMAEKQRRDNLNTQIATMASLVPTVSNGGSRKKDKISVLRLTAAHLRVAYTLGVSSNKFLPRQFNDFDLENCLINNLAGSSSFLLVVTTTGKIIYISRHVEEHLGHEQMDLIGDSLYNYTYEKDHEELTRGLTPDQSCLVGTSITGLSDSLEDSSNSSDESTVRPEYSNFKTQRRSFNIRMTQRTNSRRETPQYEYVQISGVLRLANECRDKERSKTAENTSTSNDIIFVGTGRLLKKRSITELSVLEANKNEYFTRHLPDGRIIFCDHRISIIAGYMSDEVSGTSAFKFMHKEDVRWTIVALREMYDGGKNYGSSCYRLMTKTGDYIYLRTHGYLEYDESANCITSFVCINTLTTEEEGEILIAEMKKRFSAITSKGAVKAIRDDGFESESECSSTSHFIENIDDSSQLEDAVAHLLSDLPQPIIEDRDSPAPLPNSQLVKAAIYSQSLPPAAIQANKVGIKDITNAYAPFGKGGKGGKNGKGKRNPGGKKDIGNGENGHSPNNSKGVKMYGEKKMPELGDPSSPVTITPSQVLVPIAEKVFPLANEVDELDPDLRVVATLELPPIPKSERNQPPTFPSPFEMKELYNEGSSIKTNDDVQLPPPQQKPRQQTGIKRPYEHLRNTNNISSKKRNGDNGDNGAIISDSIPIVNGDYSAAYVPIQPIPLSEIQQVQSEFKQLEANEISTALTDDQYLNFQDMADDQLLNSAIENNPAIIKLFSKIPSTITLDGTEVEDQNAHQYPTSDQGIVVENEVRHAHLQLADSMSSCESQFSDPEDSTIVPKCDGFTHEHNDHNIQKQQLTGLKRNVQHDIGV